ncbi:MAG: cupin domain-containing protein [Candidatus Acidiferrales bacterium]
MERRAILQSLIAGLAIGSIKTVCDADDKGKDTKGLLVPFGQDRNRAGPRQPPGHPFILSGKDTGGALAIMGPLVAPDQCLATHSRLSGGIPLHVHYAQDEYWYVIRGEHLVQVGDKKFYAKAGDLVFGPRGVPHSPRGLTEHRVGLTMWQPAGTMEEFFHELDEAVHKAGGKLPPHDAFAALFKAHGMKIVGPPVEP